MEHKGLDGSHDFRDSVDMHLQWKQGSSSTGPAPAGPAHEEMTASSVPMESEFMASHAMSRGSGYNTWGSYTGPTTPGHLGSNPMFPSPEPHFSMNMEATNVTQVGGHAGPAAYAWPDAPGGDLGHCSDEFKR